MFAQIPEEFTTLYQSSQFPYFTSKVLRQVAMWPDTTEQCPSWYKNNCVSGPWPMNYLAFTGPKFS